MSILIFFPEGNVENNPTLLAFVHHLDKLEINYEIRANKNEYTLKASRFGKTKNYTKIISKLNNFVLVNSRSFRVIRSVILFYNLKYLVFKPKIVIGVDREGIIQASALASTLRVKSFAFSFEIFFLDETSQYFKAPEIEACEYINNFFVQDEIRAGLLARENHIPIERLIYLPLGYERSSEFALSKVNLRDFYGIAKETKIACVIGSLTSWSGYLRILESVASWPENWIIFIHSRAIYSEEDLPEKYRYLLGDRIVISRHTYLDFEELEGFISQIDLGIAFYFATFASRYSGKNLESIGYASGKIATFLRSGVPIVTNVKNELTAELEKRGIGYALNSVETLHEILVTFESKEHPSNKAKNFHDGVLAYENYANLIEKLIFEMIDEVH
jgi:hypothetical protein